MVSSSDLRQPPGALFCWSLRVVGLVGLGLSAYLLWLSVSAGRAAGCGPDSGFDCDSVLASEWSKWLGVPVSLGAVVIYAAMLLATGWIKPTSVPRRQRRAWSVLLLAAVAAAGAALWFIYLQKYRLDNSICLYCMAAHLCSIVIAVMVLVRVPIAGRGAAKDDSHALGTSPAVGLCGLALVGLAVLIGGQLASDPEETEYATTLPPDSSQPNNGAGTPGNPTPKHRLVKLYKNKVKVDTYDMPIQGSPDAKFIMLEIFDYTCSHCRRLHMLLQPLQNRYGDQVAVVLAPMPLDSDCNRLMKHTPRAHIYGCELARIGLAVWRADRTAFYRFHHWAFEPQKSRRPTEAKAYAADLVGREKLESALKDPWIDKQINMNVMIWKAAGKPPIPRLITRTHVMLIKYRDQLYDFLEAGLGLERMDIDAAPATDDNLQ